MRYSGGACNNRNKLKSLKVTKWRKDEWGMNEEWWRMKVEWWRIKVEWWRMMISSCSEVLVYDRQMNEWTDKRTDICECRVGFATENCFRSFSGDMCQKSIVYSNVRTRIKASSGKNESLCGFCFKNYPKLTPPMLKSIHWVLSYCPFTFHDLYSDLTIGLSF